MKNNNKVSRIKKQKVNYEQLFTLTMKGIFLYLVESIYKSIRERSNVQQKIGNEYKQIIHRKEKIINS